MNLSQAAHKKIIAMDYVQILLQYMREQSICEKQLLAQANIDGAAVSDKEGFLSVAQYGALLKVSQQSLHDPVLGLRLGQLQNIAAHGPLGYAILSSKSTDEAMDKVCRFIRIRNNLTRIHYQRSDEHVILSMEVDLPTTDPLYQFVVEQSFSSFVFIVKSLSGLKVLPIAAEFCYEKPSACELYEDVFGLPASFLKAENRLLIKKSYLSEFSLAGDVTFAGIAEQQCKRIIAGLQREEGIVTDIYDIFSKSGGDFPSQKAVAAQLNISVRSLVRKLAQQQMSFSQIVKNSKFELAKHYLSSSDNSTEEIAHYLGYENAGNFSRFFKKESGQSPSDYRRQFKP
mgnify:CR=1 FL=1